MPESNENFRQIDNPDEQQKLLAQSTLDIQMAGYEPHENVFLAAHGPKDSILACRHTGELMIWHVLRGTKHERKTLAESIREKFRLTT